MVNNCADILRNRLSISCKDATPRETLLSAIKQFQRSYAEHSDLIPVQSSRDPLVHIFRRKTRTVVFEATVTGRYPKWRKRAGRIRRRDCARASRRSTVAQQCGARRPRASILRAGYRNELFECKFLFLIQGHIRALRYPNHRSNQAISRCMNAHRGRLRAEMVVDEDNDRIRTKFG